MKTIYIGFGREINTKWHGARIGKARGVWLLPDTDWSRFKSDMLNLSADKGRILFAGEGSGLNTVTGAFGEPGYCIALEVTDGRSESLNALCEALAAIAGRYGQAEIAVAIASPVLVKTGANRGA